MNPAKRKKLYRASLREETKKVADPIVVEEKKVVVEEKKSEPVIEKQIVQPALGLKELPKEEPSVEAVAATVEQSTATASKKKKV